MPKEAFAETFYSLQDQQPQRQRQYVIIQQRVPSKPVQRVEYHASVIETVKGLTVAQLCFGVTIFIFHIIVTAMGDNFYSQLDSFKTAIKDPTFEFAREFPDQAGTGVWVGLLAIVTAGLGFGAYQKQTKGFILFHLILNVVLLLCAFILTLTLSVNMNRLSSCRRNGLIFSSSNDWNSVKNSTTASIEVYQFFGEEIKGPSSSGYFYCRHTLFKTWLGLDSFLVLCSVIEFFIMLSLLIYNSAAVCFCCRRTGCCGKCCTCCYGSLDDTDEQVVSYCTEPRDAAVIPSVPMTSLDMVAGIILPSSALPPFKQSAAIEMSSQPPLSSLDAMFSNMAANQQTATVKAT